MTGGPWSAGPLTRELAPGSLSCNDYQLGPEMLWSLTTYGRVDSLGNLAAKQGGRFDKINHQLIHIHTL